MNRTDNSPIFIVGRPRSGTTLIATILDESPDVAFIADETFLLTRWAEKFGRGERATSDHFCDFWSEFSADDFFRTFRMDADRIRARIADASTYSMVSVLSCLGAETARIQGKLNWGEKTPLHFYHIRELLQHFPHASILCMVRDPRANLASLKRVNWTKGNPEMMGRRWNEYVDIVKTWSADPRVMTVKYEDLVTEPTRIVEGLCRKLGIAFTQAMISRPRMKNDILGIQPRNSSIHRNLVRPINPHSIHNWRQMLSPREIRLIEGICGDRMTRFGYSAESEGMIWRDKMELLLADATRPALDALRKIKRWYKPVSRANGMEAAESNSVQLSNGKKYQTFEP